MKVHKYGEMIPTMNEKGFSELKESIKSIGQLVPIVMIDDEILDGRHRYRACDELGIEPDTVQYTGDDPLGYAVGINATRRNLNQSQRALIAANIANMGQGGVRSGQNTNASQSANLHVEVSSAKAGKMLNVSERSVKTVRKLKSTAPTSVIKAIESGDLTINAAQKLVDNIDHEILEKTEPAQIKALLKTHDQKDDNRSKQITQPASNNELEVRNQELVAQARIDQQTIDRLTIEIKEHSPAMAKPIPEYDGLTSLREALAIVMDCSPKSGSTLIKAMNLAKPWLSITKSSSSYTIKQKIKIYEFVAKVQG